MQWLTFYITHWSYFKPPAPAQLLITCSPHCTSRKQNNHQPEFQVWISNLCAISDCKRMYPRASINQWRHTNSVFLQRSSIINWIKWKVNTSLWHSIRKDLLIIRLRQLPPHTGAGPGDFLLIWISRFEILRGEAKRRRLDGTKFASYSVFSGPLYMCSALIYHLLR